MTTVPEAQPHTEAFIACLHSAGIPAADSIGAFVDGAGNPTKLEKYAVVYADLGTLDGPLGDQYADLEQTVFVHGIGIGPEQAQWVADKSRRALLVDGVTVPGRAVLRVRHVTSQPVQRDDDQKPPLFFTVDQYALFTTPA